MRVKLGDICTKGASSLKQKDVFGKGGSYPVYGASGCIGAIDSFHQQQEYVAVVKDGAGIGRAMLLPAQSSVIGTMQYLLPKKGISAQYLFYVVQHLHLEKFFSGATIPHIYFKDYKNEAFRCHPQDKQQEIIAVLGNTQKIIQKRKQQLQKLDELVKARFVEMFIGVDSQTPKWNRVSLSTLCSSIVRGPFGSALKKEFFVSETSETRKVYEQKNAIDQSYTIGSYFISKEKFQELARFECGPGDFIMSCSGTIGKLYQLPNTAKKGVINQALCRFTLNDAILPEVFLEFMRYSVSTLETKGSGIQNIGAVSYIKNIPVPLAPKEVQLRFAQLVQEVDKSKVVVQKSLEKAQQLYDSLMQQYFD